MQQHRPNEQIEIQQCIQNCLECHKTCMQMAEEDRRSRDDHATKEHIQMMLDCAEICLTTAHFLQHGSALAGYVVQACAQVTTICANECEQAGHTDCANACRNAAWSCTQLTKMIPG